MNETRNDIVEITVDGWNKIVSVANNHETPNWNKCLYYVGYRLSSPAIQGHQKYNQDQGKLIPKSSEKTCGEMKILAGSITETKRNFSGDWKWRIVLIGNGA